VSERVGSDVEDVQVPAFILQPLVENCVQHGMRPDGPLNIEIAVERHDGAITMSVSDDGLGIEPDALASVLEAGTGKGLGIALRNVQDRVRGHYGPGSGLDVSSEHGAGTTVTVTLVQSRTDTSGVDRA
jgi:two-component system sensor histidine kinase LytS